LILVSKEPVKVLTVGGSDSGGAAGIQADLKTWTAMGVYGMSAITAVTAQNSVTVEAVQFVSAELVAAQIDAVLSDYGAQAIKTGFIGRAELIEQVADSLKDYDEGPLVVDPVLVNHKGHSMFPAQVAAAYGSALLPLATLVTPNWREAALLCGNELERPPQETDVRAAAETLCEKGAEQALITGVPGEYGAIVDWWYDGEALHPLPQQQILTENRHGSGDTLSAAICANLALDMETAVAIVKAQEFCARALQAAKAWRLGRGHGPLSHLDMK
jgi:hydroxymethylpyrimidine/phosphomethylpyrimidine kinase